MKLKKDLIRLLKENSRYTNEFMAKELGVSEGTVRNRIRKLVDDKEILSFTVKTKDDVSAICMIETDTRKKTEDIFIKIKNIEGIDEVFEVSGEFTFVCKISKGSLSEVNDIIEKVRNISGVINTKTYTVLNFFQR